MTQEQKEYGGYISAIRVGDASMKPIWVTARNESEAVTELKKKALQEFPLRDGWTNHATSSEEGLATK